MIKYMKNKIFSIFLICLFVISVFFSYLPFASGLNVELSSNNNTPDFVLSPDEKANYHISWSDGLNYPEMYCVAYNMGEDYVGGKPIYVGIFVDDNQEPSQIFGLKKDPWIKGNFCCSGIKNIEDYPHDRENHTLTYVVDYVEGTTVDDYLNKKEIGQVYEGEDGEYENNVFTITIYHACRIYGHVVNLLGFSIPGIKVQLISEDFWYNDEKISSNPEGEFTFWYIPLGVYTIKAIINEKIVYTKTVEMSVTNHGEYIKVQIPKTKIYKIAFLPIINRFL